MSQTSISVWFVCKLCQSSFRLVDAFIEHKKEKHFTEFQKTTSIVFEETESNEPCPVTIKAEAQPTDENTEPPIKIEVINDSPIITPVNSEIIDDPNLDLVEPKSELIIFETEVTPKTENNDLSLKQPDQNPYVLLERLTAEEIERASIPQNQSRLLKVEPKNFENDLEPPNLPDVDSTMTDHTEGEHSAEIQPTAAVTNVSTEHNPQFECKLCSKQFQSDARLKIHVQICARYHKHGNRYCVTCNKKLSNPKNLKSHCVRFHGTEEQKSSMYMFKCHFCPKQYRRAVDLRCHLGSHKPKKQQAGTSGSPSKPFVCSWPNCKQEYNTASIRCLFNESIAIRPGQKPSRCSGCGNVFMQSKLREHLRITPEEELALDLSLNRSAAFSSYYKCLHCGVPFSKKSLLKEHLRIHPTGGSYKCAAANCYKSFVESGECFEHYQAVHSNLPDIDNTMLCCNNEVGKSTEIQPTAAPINISTEPPQDLQLQCKLCSEQLESVDQLWKHVKICALHHKDLNQFCVTCNKIFLDEASLQTHCVKIHGNLKERLWPYNLRCRICPKQYKRAWQLNWHLEEFHKMKPEPELVVGKKKSGSSAPRIQIATKAARKEKRKSN